jgi:hypothetical protein
MRFGLKWLWYVPVSTSYEHRNVVYGNVCISGCWIVKGILASQEGILIIKTNNIHYSQLYFGKELYMFRTDFLSIIRSLNTVFTGNWYSFVAASEECRSVWTRLLRTRVIKPQTAWDQRGQSKHRNPCAKSEVQIGTTAVYWKWKMLHSKLDE